MDFDERYQLGKDGPLTLEFRGRVEALRPEYTLADIGKLLGFSGAFISQLLNSNNPSHVRSLHIPRIVAAIEGAEAKRSAPQHRLDPGDTEDDLAEHVRAIHRLGFNVTLIPRER